MSRHLLRYKIWLIAFSIVSLQYVRYTKLHISQHRNHKGETHMTVDISDIENIIQQENAWRQTRTINLIASENTPSAAVQRVQLSDFMGRYAEGHPNEGDKVNRYYQGTRYIDEI